MTGRKRAVVIPFDKFARQKSKEGGVTMTGGVYSDQKCQICNGTLKDNFRNGLSCSRHPEQHATKFRVHFRKVKKRFNSYVEAARFLNFLRYEVDKGLFDPAEYKSLSFFMFNTLAETWLKEKEANVKPSTFRTLELVINSFGEFIGNQDVRLIKKADFQAFFKTLKVSNKTISNYRSVLHQFFMWLYEAETIKTMPKIPSVKFTLAWRKIIDKTTQTAVIDEVYRISSDKNIKIWLGIKFLATYFNTRPIELLHIKEKDIDLSLATIQLTHTKEGKTKFIYLLDEDVQLLKQFPKAMPALYFFRHKNGNRFGEKYFYKWWKKACKNLGILDVDLYGGTRHSTVSALRETCTPEQIKLASMHSTNKAFDRYFQVDPDYLRNVYQGTRQKKIARR